MIYLDTDRLRQMVSTLESANQRIDEATEVLMQITTHDDWGCAERHQINEYILKCRSNMQQVQSTGGSFNHIMKQVAEEFIETENNISSLFAGLEGVLSRILSVVLSGMSGTISADTVIKNAANVTEHVVSAYQSIVAPIPIFPTVWETVQILAENQGWEPINMPTIWETVQIIAEGPYHTGNSGSNPAGTSIWMEEGFSVFKLKDFEI